MEYNASRDRIYAFGSKWLIYELEESRAQNDLEYTVNQYVKDHSANSATVAQAAASFLISHPSRLPRGWSTSIIIMQDSRVRLYSLGTCAFG